jgi:hypothetical protein
MCTYLTVRTELAGSGKGPNGTWFALSDAAVYLDHPVHAQAEHTLNVDLAAPALGPGARIAVELTPASARELVRAIETALAAAPSALTA